MAVVMKIEAPGATPDQYDALNEALGIIGDDTAPDGLIIHMAGISEDGMVVVDVWESEEKLNAFFENALGAALEASDMEAGPPEIHKLHHMIPQGMGTGDNVMVEIETDAGPDVYDEMSADMPTHAGDGSGHPVVVHVAAVTDEGKVYIMDLWESPEAFGAFAENEIAPRDDGRMGEIKPRIIPVHNVIRGSAKVTA